MARPAPALSTIAARNPMRAMQPTRKRGKSGKSDASKATNGLATTFTHEQRLLLEEDVEEYAVSFQEKVMSLSIKHGRKELFIRKKLHNGTTYSKRRSLNIRSAVMHDLSVKAKGVGDAGDLETLRTKLSTEEYKELIENMTDDERTRLLQQLAEHCGFKHQGVRATNKAVVMDTMQTAAHIGDLLEDLFERTGVRAFTFFTCSDPDDPAVPHIVDSNNVCAYFQQVFRKSFIDFLRKFEQWSCVQDTEEKEQNDVDSVRKQIVTLILDGLRKIKNKKNIGMDYVNYKLDIQHKLGVKLAGWPTEIPFVRPLKLRAEQAREIRDGLRSGLIHWVALSKTQRRDLAEELAGDGLRRKERSDKGKKRARREARSDSEEEDDSDSDSEEDDDDGSEEEDEEEEAPAARTKAPAAVVKAPTARAAPSTAPRVASRAPANANAARVSNLTVPSVSNVHANTATHTAMPSDVPGLAWPGYPGLGLA
ncbi:hypothetical protein B0H19DRAFT_1252300 [Mycena capillaripes]|nr:hypothetical protein B0H19DRAFT_1252300 [Mycena capillaripes]